MANGGTYVKNRFDLFALEDLVFARTATDGRVVLAPRLQHRTAPSVARRIAGAARSMPTPASLVKPRDEAGGEGALVNAGSGMDS
jgi:hypothetical protein